MHHRLPATRKERPTRPQHDGNGQEELDPALRGHVHPLEAVAKHGEHKHPGGQWQRPPEAALKIAQLRVVVVFDFRQQGLQRHAAFGTVARMVLANLWVHRAGVDGAGGGWRRVRWCRGHEVLQRVRRELALALGTAEVVGSPLVFQRVCRLRRDLHAAHRVLEVGGRRGHGRWGVAAVVLVCAHVHGPTACRPVRDRVPAGADHVLHDHFHASGASVGRPATTDRARSP